MEKAVFFNLDGTLTTEVPYQQITSDLLSEKGVEESKIDPWRYYELFFQRFESMHEDPYGEAFADYTSEFGLELDPYELGSEYMDRELDHVAPAEGLSSVLDDLDGRYELGIITDGIVDLQERKIESLDVEDWFSTILISYRDGGHKEQLDIFRKAQNELDHVDEFLYVSHKDRDIESAEEAGWETLQKRVPDLRSDFTDF